MIYALNNCEKSSCRLIPEGRRIRQLTPSFRVHLTMDSLGVQLSPSHYRAGSGLSPFRFRPCRAHYERGCLTKERFRQIAQRKRKLSLRTSDRCHWCGNPPDFSSRYQEVSLLTGGFPRQCAHWLGMTVLLFVQFFFSETAPYASQAQPRFSREFRYLRTISATLKTMAWSNWRRSRPVIFLIFSSR